MRSDPHIDSTAPVFTLICPGYRKTQGNLSFSIGGVVAEIGRDDLIESWQAAAELSPAETVKMAETAASHLTGLIDSGLGPVDLTDAVTDAAVVLLLAMKRQGISDPKRIPACTVMWNGQEGRERVVMGE